jgi:hypothetical protein
MEESVDLQDQHNNCCKEADEPSDKEANKPSGKKVNESSNKEADKSSNKEADESSDKEADKSSDKKADKSSDKEADKKKMRTRKGQPFTDKEITLLMKLHSEGYKAAAMCKHFPGRDK